MNPRIRLHSPRFSRRDILRGSLAGIGASATLPLTFSEPVSGTPVEGKSSVDSGHRKRILVVVELDGGNDGLNTVIPYGDDAYYQQRPQLAIP
ncbi:MAG: hypothetical protein MKZ89_14345, partial [Nisaea sp.]|nr:hypothetical protein [Nisaea sp.]